MRQLRGPALYPTAAGRFFETNGYLRPGQGSSEAALRRPPSLRSAHTVKNWANVFSQIQRAHPGKRVNEFTEKDLVEFLRQGQTARTGKNWSPQTVATYRTALEELFDWAHWDGLCATNPALHLKRYVGTAKTPQKVHNWLTPGEVNSLLATCGADAVGARDRILIQLLVNTGLRVSEASALCWSQVNLFAKNLQLVGKGGKPANVPLRPALHGGLVEWKSLYEAGLGATPLHHPVLTAVAVPNKLQPDFKIRWGTPLGTGGIQSRVKYRGSLIGRPNLAPHDLRRTFAGLMELSGEPLRVIQQRLRHSSIATTEAYLSDNALVDVGEARALY